MKDGSKLKTYLALQDLGTKGSSLHWIYDLFIHSGAKTDPKTNQRELGRFLLDLSINHFNNKSILF